MSSFLSGVRCVRGEGRGSALPVMRGFVPPCLTLCARTLGLLCRYTSSEADDASHAVRRHRSRSRSRERQHGRRQRSDEDAAAESVQRSNHRRRHNRSRSRSRSRSESREKLHRRRRHRDRSASSSSERERRAHRGRRHSARDEGTAQPAPAPPAPHATTVSALQSHANVGTPDEPMSTVVNAELPRTRLPADTPSAWLSAAILQRATDAPARAAGSRAASDSGAQQRAALPYGLYVPPSSSAAASPQADAARSEPPSSGDGAAGASSPSGDAPLPSAAEPAWKARMRTKMASPLGGAAGASPLAAARRTDDALGGMLSPSAALLQGGEGSPLPQRGSATALWKATTPAPQALSGDGARPADAAVAAALRSLTASRRAGCETA
ncbi:hypothetical protein EON68_03830, partial [archaeon]